MEKSEELLAMPENQNESPCNVYHAYLIEKNNPSLDIFVEVCIDFFNNFTGDVDAMEKLWEAMVNEDYCPTSDFLSETLTEIIQRKCNLFE